MPSNAESALRIATLCVFAATVSAQSLPDSFPAEDMAPTEAELRALLSGRDFKVIRPEGGHITISFFRNGYVFAGGSIDLSVDRIRGEGRWKVAGSTVCLDWFAANFDSTCLEARKSDDGLILRRSSGELVRWIPE